MKGDVAVSLSLPPETDKAISKMALKRGTSRREIVIQAVKLLAEAK
jgi:predicted transcriptional regulator